MFEHLLLRSWPLFQVWACLVFGLFFQSLFSQIQNLAFFKTEFGLFQLQAPGNPGRTCRWREQCVTHHWPLEALFYI